MFARMAIAAVVCGVVGLVASGWAMAQTPGAFTYQGRLESAGVAYDGTADLRFRLFDAAAGGNQIGVQQTVLGQTIAKGTFSSSVDFGAAAFADGSPRWLEVGVRTPGSGAEYVTLAPRQSVSPAPSALGLAGMPITTVEAVESVDQSQLIPLSVAVGAADQWQSFTAGKTGTLTRVDLAVFVPGATSIAVDIRAGVGLEGPVIGTATTAIPGFGTNVITLRYPNTYVVAGQKYTIVLPNSFQYYYGVPTLAGAQGSRGWGFYFVTGVTPTGTIRAVASAAGTASSVPWSGVFGVPQSVTNPFAPWVGSGTSISYVGGNVGIGTASPGSALHVSTGALGIDWQLRLTNTAAPALFQGGMRVSDDGFVEVTNRLNGQISFARLGSTGVWTAVSDGRLKRDVTPAEKNLETALRIRPVQFRWIDDGPGGKVDFGVIAQELRDVMPELVTGDESRQTLTVDYARLSVVAVGAIREQQTRIDALNAQVRAQQEQLRGQAAENAELRSRLERLEATVGGPRVR